MPKIVLIVGIDEHYLSNAWSSPFFSQKTCMLFGDSCGNENILFWCENDCLGWICPSVCWWMNERTWHKNCNLPPPLLLKGVKSRRDFKCQNCKHVNPPMHTRASGDFSRCDPAGIQTQDLQNRNLTLYSAKLRSHFFSWCKDSARRAENKRKTCFSFFSRAAAYLGRKPKCARRAENKRKTCFSFSSEVQPILWTHSECVWGGLPVKSARRLGNSTSTAEFSKRLADFQGWGLNIHNWFSAASRVRGKWPYSRL